MQGRSFHLTWHSEAGELKWTELLFSRLLFVVEKLFILAIFLRMDLDQTTRSSAKLDRMFENFIVSH
jgi:hypothetical protein